ncbi:MAG: DUF2723 domain-containing protein [bacterium]
MINKLFIIILILIIACLYLSTLKPSVGAGDTAELAAAASTLGIAHSPGYPLFTIFGKMAHTALPFANSAYRINLLSFISAILSLCLLVFVLSDKNPITVLVSVGLLAVSPIFWEEAIISEVFSLNFLFALVMLALLYRDLYKPFLGESADIRKIYLISFLFGLFLGDHHTLILLSPGIGLYFFFKLKDLPLMNVLRILFYSLAFFAIGFSIYIYLPIRSLANPLLDWEDPETFERFWGVIKRSRYGSLSLAQGGSRGIDIHTIIEELIFYGKLLFKNYSLIGIIFLFIGAVKSYFMNKKLFFTMLLIFFFSGPFMFIWANVPHTNHTEYIMERFFLLSLIPVTIFVSLGLIWIDDGLRKANKTITAAICIIAVLSISIFALSRQKMFLFNRGTLQIYDTGKNVLKHLPKGSLLFADRADEVEFSLAYLKYAQKLRKDVLYIDCNAGVSRSIYGNDYYRIWGEKRLAIRNLVEQSMISNHSGDVYYATLLPEQTSTNKINEGMLYLTKGKLVNNTKLWSEVLIPPRGESFGDDREKQMFYSYYKSLAEYYVKSNEDELARKYYMRYLSSGGSWYRWGLNVAYDLYASKKLRLSADIYEQYLNRYPEEKTAWNNLGAVYNEMNNLKLAVNAFDKVLSIDPNYAEAYYNLAVVSWKNKNWLEAEALLKKALEINPEYKEARHLLSRLPKIFNADK